MLDKTLPVGNETLRSQQGSVTFHTQLEADGTVYLSTFWSVLVRSMWPFLGASLLQWPLKNKVRVPMGGCGVLFALILLAAAFTVWNELTANFRLLICLTLLAWLWRRFVHVGAIRKKVACYVAMRRVPTVSEGHWLLCQAQMLRPDVALTNWRRWLSDHPRIVRLSRGPLTDFVVVHHPEVAAEILRTSQHCREEYIYSFLEPWLGNGLLTVCQGDCRARRKPLMAAQGPRQRARHARIYNDALQDLYSLWDEKCAAEGGSIVDVQAAMRMLSLDIIVQCAFAGRWSCQGSIPLDGSAASEVREYAETVPKLLRMTVDRLLTLRHHCDRLFWMSEQGHRYQQLLEKAHKFTSTAVRCRIETRCTGRQGSQADKTTGTSPSLSSSADLRSPTTTPITQPQYSHESHPRARKPDANAALSPMRSEGASYDQYEPESDYEDFLDVLLKQYGSPQVDVKTIRNELDSLVFAGHDTTACALAWTLYYLSQHKEAQRRCQEEVDAASSSFEPTFPDTGAAKCDSLTYLTQCLKESLRLASVVPHIHRRLGTDCDVAGYRLRAGTRLLVSLWGIHHNPEVWPRAEEFLPERFSPGTSMGICSATPCPVGSTDKFDGNCTLHAKVKNSFLPFSLGPRACLGQSMAMHELTSVLAMLLRRYDFSFDSSMDKPQPAPIIVMHATHGVHLRVTRRSVDTC